MNSTHWLVNYENPIAKLGAEAVMKLSVAIAATLMSARMLEWTVDPPGGCLNPSDPEFC